MKGLSDGHLRGGDLEHPSEGVTERGRYDELLARGGRFTEIFAEQAA
ncbi:hypothetical protein [Brachybacterium sp. FME24]|nr:hypothetical protein [Brachybacterium sp. FME24]